MQKTVLGIVASPRKTGNSEILAKEVARNMGEGWRLRLIRLHEFRIEPCVGCYRCLFGGRACFIDDDHAKILEELAEADALLVVAPAYFLSANSQLKRFLDRCLSLYAHIDRLWGKPAVGAAVAGIPGREGFTLLSVESFLKLIMADVRHTAVLYGALPGEVALSDENRRVAASLAAALIGGATQEAFASQAPADTPRCPLCGGFTFRFIGPETVRCMLCSNEGPVIAEKGALRFDIRRGEHQLFLSKEEAVAHKEWLMGMKERFLAQKKTLKEVCQTYRKEGEIVRPSEGGGEG